MRDDRAPRLADAQRAVAQDLGFPSWPALVATSKPPAATARSAPPGWSPPRSTAATTSRSGCSPTTPSSRAAGLASRSCSATSAPWRPRCDRDPDLVARDLPGAGRKPLSCACHSVFLRPTSPRAPGVRRVVELLLDAAPTPNEVHHNEYGAMSVLYGAAGVAHDLETTRLLLDRGANPDDGESVYHAVEADDTACLELLLARGATVRDTNALGNAIGDPRKVRVLLEQGDLRPSDPELRDALLHARDPRGRRAADRARRGARRPRRGRSDAVLPRRAVQERRR